MPDLLILTEAGPTWGGGHLTRCTALAAACEQLGWSARLLVQMEIPETTCPAPGHTADWHACPETWQDMKQADLVLLDSYHAPPSTIGTITAFARNFATIDDFPRRNYQRGTVIDWSLGAEHYAYPQRCSQATYLLGSSYACLRQPFWNVVSHCPSSVGRILIMFGSGDIRALTGPALAAIFSNFPDTSVDVATGMLGVADTLKNQWRDHPLNIHPHLDAVAVRQLMLACDIAICGGGQTLYELAACGTPAVAIELIDNQRDDLLHFATAGLIDLAGHWHDPDLWVKVVATIAALRQSPSTLTRRACQGQSLIDGQGALRLARQLAASSGFPLFHTTPH